MSAQLEHIINHFLEGHEEYVKHIVSKLNEQKIEVILSKIDSNTSRVEAAKIIYKITRNYDLYNIFCTCIENEEGWGPDDHYYDGEENKELAKMRNELASYCVSKCSNIKEHGNIRSSAREYLDEIRYENVKELYDALFENKDKLEAKILKVCEDVENECEALQRLQDLIYS